ASDVEHAQVERRQSAVAWATWAGDLSGSPRRPRGSMPPKIARLAGLGAFGACAAFVALFAFVAKISSPSATGGMMPALSAVAYISVGLVVLALIGVHVVIGRQLIDL